MVKHSNEEDSIAFKEAMQGVKRLKAPSKVSPPFVLSPRVRRRATPEESAPFHFTDHEHRPPVNSEDLLEFHRSGISHKILRNLRQGQYNVEAILDLHGMTVEEAKNALGRFLLQCQQQKVCHALVIHGKGRSNGKPILKNKVNHWLRETNYVLAFCSATPRDGRSGSLYVLLKSQKRRS